jgi:hypothetical protein
MLCAGEGPWSGFTGKVSLAGCHMVRVTEVVSLEKVN